jgi:hypothetical protein
MMLFPATASAGRLIATGHDADHHCGRDTGVLGVHEQCHFFQVAVDYVRAGAPDPSKPVLVLDRGQLDAVKALDRVYGGSVARDVIEPRSPIFGAVAITTANYSAVIIASSKGEPGDPTPQDLNELNTTPDSDAINARANDLRSFYNSGGGIYVNSGSAHGDGPNDPYYAFLPVTVRGAVVVSPFVLTPAGAALGFIAHDITCCPTHNTFEPPSEGTPFQAIDTDSNGRIVSLFAATQTFAGLAEPPLTPAAQIEIVKSLPLAKKCVARSTVTLRLRRPKGVRFDRANIYRNGKFYKRVRGAKVTRPITVKVPKARGAKMAIRIVIYTTGKRKITIRRTYKTCTFSAKS